MKNPEVIDMNTAYHSFPSPFGSHSSAKGLSSLRCIVHCRLAIFCRCQEIHVQSLKDSKGNWWKLASGNVVSESSKKKNRARYIQSQN